MPIAVLALIGIRVGVTADTAADLHRDPIDVAGAVLGTATIVLALAAPTLFINDSSGSWAPWTVAAATIAAATAFVLRVRSARHPILDLRLVARPLVSNGLAYKAAAGLAVAGLSYMVTLQLQFAWGWSPALAAVGMLPQVIVLDASGRSVGPFVQRVGLDRAAWLSAAAVVAGLAVFGLLSSFGYLWILIALRSSPRACEWSASSRATTCSAAYPRTAPQWAQPCRHLERARQRDRHRRHRHDLRSAVHRQHRRNKLDRWAGHPDRRESTGLRANSSRGTQGDCRGSP